MFTNLGLFASAPCPDQSCSRPTCFFKHGSTSQLPAVRTPAKRKEISRDSSTVSPEKKVKAGNHRDAAKEPEALKARESPKARAASVKPDAGVKKSAMAPRPIQTSDKSKPPENIPLNISKPPILPGFLKNSPQPYADRQKALQTLFTQYQKLYAQILPLSPDIAHTSTLKQEAEISASSSNLKIYKNAIHQAAVSISRRTQPTNLSHPSIGTIRESRLATEKAEKEKAGKLSRDRIEKYCLPLQDFETWRYPDPTDLRLWTDVDSEVNCEGMEKVCSRCKVPFTVSSINLQAKFGECRFHHGRTAPERVEGKRKWIYSCCKRERGETGCEEGVHVFTDAEDDQVLAKRKGFMTVSQVVEQRESKEGDELSAFQVVVGLDCEMIYTTAGSSLARATIVDENGGILLDELVRQSVPVLDLNTRFSGVKEGQMEAAAMDLFAVRAAACMFIGPATIIVGHGLENDLRAMRLLHDKIIDTAILIPHDRGPPFRRALRDIVKEKLGYFIQDRTGDLGHSSAVDATATLEVLKWKVRDDND